MLTEMKYEAIVIGVSAGGMAALLEILSKMGRRFPMPVIVVQHMSPDSEDYLARHLDLRCEIAVKEAEDKEDVTPGVVYIAPPNYHLLVEPDKTLSLSSEERVNFSRPSVDVLFETAAEAYMEKLIAVILTGANSDGALGMAKVKDCNGLAVVQSPETAEADMMPKSAIDKTDVDYILPLSDIGPFLNALAKRREK